MGRRLGTQDIADFQSRLDLLPATSPTFPRPSPDLGYRLVSSRGNISLSDFVSTSIYLLSNHLHDQRDGDKGLQLLCLLFEHDAHLFTQILQSEPTTGRAALESLIYSTSYDQKGNYRFLLEFGIRHQWLDFSNPILLTRTLQMECPTDLVLSVFGYYCRFGDKHWKYILESISMAYSKGYIVVAKMLVQHFDINVVVSSPGDMSVFLAFLRRFDNNDDSHWRLLDFFLDNGADVDRLLPSSWYPRKPARWWYDKNAITRALRPTILDRCFQRNRSLFERLAKYSKIPKSAFTKTGLLISLHEGPAGLRDYLGTREPTTQIYNWRCMRESLEFLLDDQCRPERWENIADDTVQIVPQPDLKIVRSLIEYGVDWNRNSKFLPDLHSLLGKVLGQLCKEFTDDGLQLLDTLVQIGADIREEHLEDAVELEGTRFLEWLQPRVKNFSAKAAMALAKAALHNNFEAVEFLLQSGADPNAFINVRTLRRRYSEQSFSSNMTYAALEQAYSVQAIAAGLGRAFLCWGGSPLPRASLRMTQFLAERGAKLVVGPNDSTPFVFLGLLLEKAWGDTELLAKVKFVLSTFKKSKNWTNPPSFLLELCVESKICAPDQDAKELLKVFECLLDEGADVNPGSPLAALVHFGAPKELAERVLHLGAELNTYTSQLYRNTLLQTPLQAVASQGNEDLVYLFLEEGANVNSPARGWQGKTALQAICSWSPATEKEHRRKMTICDVLLNIGADINAAPARQRGETALQAAVRLGDLELTALLIHKGAHVNAPPPTKADYCALDLAAQYGRLDVFKLLLDSNALSGHRGMTGYDGALNIAQRWRHHAVASLICDHVGKGIGPPLDIPAEDYHIYGYNTDDECSDGRPLEEPYESSSDGSWSSTETDSSECDETEDCTNSEGDSLMRPASNAAGDLQTLSDSQAVGWTVPDGSMGYFGTQADLTVDDVNMEWENETLPDCEMGSLTEMLGAQTFSELQVVPNAPADDWISHSGTGLILPAQDMQPLGNEWMLSNPLDTWAGMTDDSAIWERVFEMQDQEFGFPTFDASHQLPSSDQLGEPEIEGQDAAERDYAQELRRD